MDSESSIWWTLPGPRGFLARILESLEAGRNCVVRVPATVPINALRVAVRKELTGRESLVWEHRTARELVERSREPARALAELYGIARSTDTLLSASDIALATTFHSFALWIDGWDDVGTNERRAWFEFLGQYAHAIKQRDPMQRSVICLVVAGAVALEPKFGDDVLLADHWWWSVISRLDIAVLLDAICEPNAPEDDLVDAMLVRVSGFDPQLAAWLVSARCADGAAIRCELKAYATRFALDLTPVEMALARSSAFENTPAGRGTPLSLAIPWSRGLVNHLRKEGVHWHLAALTGAGDRDPLRHELWAAQASVLLPRIDQQRALICRYLDARYGNCWSRWDEGNDDRRKGEIVQIGDLKYLFDTDSRLRREPDELRRLVRWLRFARNELSHLRELPLEELRRGRESVERAANILDLVQAR